MARHLSSALAVAALMVVSGCALREPVDLAEHDVRMAHPIGVGSAIATAAIDRPAEGKDIDPTGRAILADLATEFRQRGAGRLAIRVGAPEGEAEMAAARDFGEALAARLVAAGIGRDSIDVLVVKENPGKAVLSIPVWAAQLPVCGNFERPVNPDFGNAPNSNFGCAIRRNIGQMVTNPADLVRARDSSGRDGSRAVEVLDKYAKGQASGSAREGATSLSDAVRTGQ